MRRAHLMITAREALDRLDDIRLAKNEVAGRVFLCPVESEARHKEVLGAVGIKNIPRIRFLSAELVTPNRHLAWQHPL